MSKEIDLDLVRRVGKLSRIDLTESQVTMLAGQLGSILEYFDKLQELDTENVEPMVHAVDIHDVFGADEIVPSLTPDQALANAPQREGDLFVVPKVIAGGSQ